MIYGVELFVEGIIEKMGDKNYDIGDCKKDRDYHKMDER